MDDVWGNAWGEPTQTASVSQPWSSRVEPPPEDKADEEADLSMPSWSTGADIQWDEPSNHQPSLWSSQAVSAEPWSPANPYSDIPLRRTQPSEPSEPSTPTAESHDPSPPSPTPEDVSYDDDHHDAPSIISDPSPPSSPDAFGTFEVGAPQPDADPWTATSMTFGARVDPPSTEWRSAWSEQKEESVKEQERVDEWEAARRRKEELDRRVPPELLSGILAQVEQLSESAWPEPEAEQDEAEWQTRWNTGLDGVDNMHALRHRYVPELTLPQLTPFGKSFTGKALANAIKLSRNSAVARNSPLAHFLASKGSTAWETAVKSRVEVVTDEVPQGWRILEKEREEKVEEKTKKGGGLLASLWGRRVSAGPVKTAAPVQESSTAPPTKDAPFARPSLESIKSVNSDPASFSSKPQSPISSVPSPFSASPAPTATSTQTVPTTSYSDSGLPSFEPITREATSPPPGAPPSAVSRFLGRFSRPRTSPHNSLALSSEDLEFLGEVPSAEDLHESQADDFGFGGLSAGFGDLGGGKVPPVLPPPPSSGTVVKTRAQYNGLFPSFDELVPVPSAGPSSTQGASSERSATPLSLSSRPITPVSQPPRNGRTASHSSSSSITSVPTEIDLSSDISLARAPSNPNTRSAGLFPDFDDLVLGSTPSTATSKSAALPHLSSLPITPISQPPRRGQTMSHSSLSSMLSSPAEIKPASSPFTLPPPPTASPRPGLISPPPRPASTQSQTTVSSRVQNAAVFNSTPLLKSHIPALSPPPPPSSLSTLKASISAVTPDFDDDFSDFHTSSSPQIPPSASFLTTSFASAAPDTEHFVFPPPSKPSHAHTASAFDDFSDLLSSPTSASHTVENPLLPPADVNVIAPSPGKTLLQRRRSSRAVNDEHTLNLISRAAARPGRWPAPASPLPEAIAPPPPPATRAESNGLLSPDLFGTPTESHFSVPPSASSPAALGTLAESPRARGHQKTLSLLELAASRPGRWPAPPSPLPEALSPPPPSPGTRTNMDLLDASTPMDAGSKFSMQQSMSSPAVLGLSGVPTPPQSESQTPSPIPMLPPPGAPPPGGFPSSLHKGTPIPKPQSPLQYSPESTPLALLVGGMAQPAPAPPPPLSSGQKGAGGLSAQDLSFFEGL